MKYYTFSLLVITLLARVNDLPAQIETSPESIHSRIEKAERILFSQPDQALTLARSVLVLSQQQAYILGQAKANKIISRIFAFKGDYKSALETSHSALTLFQELEMPGEICKMYISQGVIYRYLKLHDESIVANQEAEKLANNHNITELKAAIYGNLGNVYFDQQKYDQALKYHLQSLKIDTELKNEQGIGNTYHNIGMIYRTRKKYDQALECYQKSLDIDLKRNNHQNIIVSYVELAEVYMETGNFKQALPMAIKALEKARSINSKSLERKVLSELPIIYASLSNPELALQFKKQYHQLNDSLQSAALSQQIANMEAQFQAEQKDKEISLQKLRIQSQQASLKQQDIFMIGVIAFVLTGCLIVVLLFNRYTLQQKNLKLSLENEQCHLAQKLQFRQNIDGIIQYFANSLYGKNTVDEILWDIAKNCISRLDFVDCVIYLLDEQQQALVQKAAFGNKNPQDYTILEPLVIPVGQGIVGSVALTGKPELVEDTSLDSRYLMDDQMRYSELAVPLLLQDKVIGVIDSEHPDKGFFKAHHLEALQIIAAICSSKITKAQADEQAKKAEILQLEAEHIKKLDIIKSQFFTNISHEFRTPLHLILAPLQKKEEEISLQELNMMERNAHRLLRLVNQLLDLAKAEVGMLALDLREGNITGFLHHRAHSFQALADNKDIHYTIDIPDQELLAPFDPDKLEKIVYNLLSNAIKFTPPGGQVAIGVAIEADDRLRIVVADSGLGVPAHLQAKIFDRFYQVDSSQTRSFEGTGIGLALTKELVELCKGSVSLDSAEGKGSAFVVSLPLKYESTESPVRSYIGSTSTWQQSISDLPIDATDAALIEEDDENAAKPTILLVEDHAELRNYLSQQLAEKFQVLLAKQGNEGLNIARKRIPDLIITDIMMPVMDGVALTRQLKEDPLTSHIPVIMLTAKDGGDSKVEGFSTGAEQYLVKPFVFGELLARINSLLTQRNRLRVKYSREVVLQPTAMTIPDREAAFLEQTIRIIEEHISDESFTVEVLQKKIGMSRMQFHRKLKALTGQSASDFIRTIRLKRAADLLQQPGMQIAEAAYLSGFSHMSYFSKSFKEQFGMLPSEYIKQSN